MGEYQALLKWYDANGTYPAETLKVALLDASAGRAADGTYLREGAKYYVTNLIPNGPQGQYAMFAEMNANGLSYPAYHLGTQYYANNINNGGVGPWRTFITDTPSAPNAPVSGHRAGLAGCEHRGQQRRDLAVRHEPPERRDGRVRAARREVRRHGPAGEPAPVQPHRVGSAAGGADAERSGVHRVGSVDVLAGASGRDERRGAGVDARGRGFPLLEPGHPGLQRRRRPGLEHRREPVPVVGQRGRPVDARPAVHGRRHGVRARKRRSRCGNDDARRGVGSRRHERQGRLRDERRRRVSRSSSTPASTSRPASSPRSARPAPPEPE